jgi:hypothetical protein
MKDHHGGVGNVDVGTLHTRQPSETYQVENDNSNNNNNNK